VRRTNEQLETPLPAPEPVSELSRGEFVSQWWDVVRNAEWKTYRRESARDADGDGVPDHDDALLFDSTNVSFSIPPVSPDADGMPNEVASGVTVIQQFNFAGKNNPSVSGFLQETGELFDEDRGFGWRRSIAQNNRCRHRTPTLENTYLFTRTHDVWEYVVPDGDYIVELSVGDSAYSQVGQNVTVEGAPVIRDHTTRKGRFAETGAQVTVCDGRLTVEIGRKGSTTNTCINWLRVLVAESSADGIPKE